MHNQHRSPDPTKIERATATSTVALFFIYFHSFFCTSQGTLGLVADPELKACWLTKNRQSRAVDLAARKGGADVMIHLLRMDGVSATERAL